MRLYFLFFFLILCVAASAQIHWAPNPDNALLRRTAAEEKKALNIPEELEMYEGVTRNNLDCPPDYFGTFIVLKGDTITINIDTVALGGGPDATLALSDCGPVLFGQASLEEGVLTYLSDPDIDGGVDTVCVDFCKPGGACQTFKYPIIVKRAGQTISPAPVVLQAEEFLNEYCLDVSGFPGALACNYFDDCLDTYDGEGQQVFYFTKYSVPDPCFRYKASRFPGTDEVCVIVCDEFTVCDTFRVRFIIQNDTLALPFFDDFSYPGPYPGAEYWLDRHAFVNNTMAENPPSVGLATFDGLNSGGRPYLSSGSADVLTSKQIDLSNPSGQVFLKFYVAPKGYGLYPNEPDSLILEFRRPEGNWEQAARFEGILNDIPIDSVPPFVFFSIQISDNAYFYKGFQFRFRNFVNPVGLYDMWHLDYVYLSDQEGPGDTYSDIAFVQPPPSFLKNYTHMPWRHFEDFMDEELNDGPLESRFFNHFSETITIADSDILLREAITNTLFPGSDNVVDGPDANIPPKEPTVRSKSLQPSTLSGYKSALQNLFSGAEKVELVLEYQLTVNSQQPLFFRNDTVRNVNHFDNYFAYDDGSAERFVFFQNPQAVSPTLAVKFRSNVADTLRGVQFHFPHVNGNAEQQLFNLKVWIGSLDTDPAYEYIFKSPLYADSKFDTLQGYTTFRLENILNELTPVGLPADTDFFIGFQQVTITNLGIPIGFDVNNSFQQNVFYNLGTGWQSFPSSFRGAPMIRAIVGTDTPIDTKVDEPAALQPWAVRIFPNPTAGRVEIEGADGAHYLLSNAMGQPVSQGILERGLDLGALPAGLYVIRLQSKEGRVWSGKIVVTQ